MSCLKIDTGSCSYLVFICAIQNISVISVGQVEERNYLKFVYVEL